MSEAERSPSAGRRKSTEALQSFPPPRAAWHDGRKTAIMPCVSHQLERLSPCGSRITNHETRNTRHETRTLSPFFLPWVRKGRTTKNRLPGRRARRQVTASRFTAAHDGPLLPTSCPRLPMIARYCSPKNVARSKSPRTVSDSRLASRRAPLAAAPVALRARSAAANAI